MSSSGYYVVTAYKGTAVTSAQTGNFTGPEDINLVQAKGSSLVVNLVTPEGLKPVLDVSIYGRVSLMKLFRPKVSAGKPECESRAPLFYLRPPFTTFTRGRTVVQYNFVTFHLMVISNTLVHVCSIMN